MRHSVRDKGFAAKAGMAQQELAASRLLALAKSAERVGDSTGAVEHYQTVLTRYPGNRTARDALARLIGVAGPAQSGSALALYRAGRYQAALRLGEQALLHNPYDRAAHDICAASLRALNKPDKALALCRTALEHWPTDATLWRDCGAVLMDLLALEEAQACFEIATRFAPDQAEAWRALGLCQHWRGAPHDALESANTALRLNPSHLPSLGLLGRVLCDLGQADESRKAHETALAHAKSPRDRAAAHTALGVLAVALGKVGCAREHYRKALNNAPDHAQTHFNLSLIAHYTARDPHVTQLRALAKRSDLPLVAQAQAHFALFNALDQVAPGSDEGFAALAAGNRLRQAGLRYNIENDIRHFEQLNTTFAKLPTSQAAPPPPDSPRPIFIVGLPRTGTTLTERMLSAAPGVRGAGELPVVETVALALMARIRKSGRGTLRPGDVTEFATILRRGLARYALGATVITDKMPLNFRFVPLLLAALPEAQIVHVTRDAMETSWSNFRTCYNSHGNGFAYDQDSMVRYHGLYSDFMKRAHAAAPDRLHTLAYEDLVADFKGQARRLVTACGLDWSKACLTPKKSARPVMTASALQVRRTVYDGNRRSWQAYADHLGPMIDGLGVVLKQAPMLDQSLPNSCAPG